MKAIQPATAADLHDQSALRNDSAAQERFVRIKLIVLWLVVLLPLAYGVYEELQEAKRLFE
jgi:hypothetical protein